MTDTMIAEASTPLADIPSAQALVPTDRRLLPAPRAALEDVAALLASGGAMVPKELRGKPEVCLAVAYMAALHGTDPVATASQTYLVGDKIAFMAQYINALVQRHFAEKPVYTYQGQGATRAVRVTAKLKSGQVIEYASPQLGQISPKNSPLWKTDPDQQLSYMAIRALARRHMPDVLLGIYAVEELQQVSIRDVTPPPPDPFAEDDGTELEHVEAEDAFPGDQEAPQEPFEPSGGFGTADSKEAAQTVPGGQTEASVDQEPLADDPLAWGAACSRLVEDVESRADLSLLWKRTLDNRRALHRADPTAYRELEAAFTARHKELPEA